MQNNEFIYRTLLLKVEINNGNKIRRAAYEKLKKTLFKLKKWAYRKHTV